jgi:hypothetical protein
VKVQQKTYTVTRLKVQNAELCVRDVVFEIVCTCNLETVVVARDGAVVVPPKYAGMSFEEVKEKVCGTCLEISDEKRQYLLAFYTLKIGLENLVQLIAEACRQRSY